MAFMKKIGGVGAVLRVFSQHAKRYPISVSAGFIFTIIAISIDVIVPLFYKRLLDTLATAEPTDAVVSVLISIAASIAGLLLLRQTARRIGSYANTYFQPRIMNDLTQTSFAHLVNHSYSFFSNNFTGSLVRRVNRLSGAFEDFADRFLFDIVPIVVVIIGITIVLFTRDTILGSLFLGWVILFAIVQFAIVRWKFKYNLRVSTQDSVATGVLADAIGNDVTIKLFAGEAHERSLFKAAADKLTRLRTLSWTIDEVINAVQSILATILEFVLIYAAIHLWQQGVLTVGDFILIQAYVIAAIERLWNLGNAFRRLYISFADASEMVEILNTPHDITDMQNASTLATTEGRIEFRDVTFRFNENRDVLSKLSLSIASKEKIALVGPSGAGKSTITKLMVRFHDVTEGGIYIDGQNIAEVTQESLRNAIAFVPQEPVLFHRTLMENIRYGRRDATDEEVIQAAKDAHCFEFITQAPQGFETYVGERGIKLSGGERQRIAIARAVLKNAPILILDEATSSLDSESEALIQDALDRLMQGKTVIAIAHRLSTVMKMDRIVVIENGTVVTSGTHDQLVNHEGGLYKKLWEIQAGGFIADDLK